jgi:hypothetical protein
LQAFFEPSELRSQYSRFPFQSTHCSGMRFGGGQVLSLQAAKTCVDIGQLRLSGSQVSLQPIDFGQVVLRLLDVHSFPLLRLEQLGPCSIHLLAVHGFLLCKGLLLLFQRRQLKPQLRQLSLQRILLRSVWGHLKDVGKRLLQLPICPQRYRLGFCRLAGGAAARKQDKASRSAGSTDVPGNPHMPGKFRMAGPRVFQRFSQTARARGS